MPSDEYAQWRQDESALARLGADLFTQNLRVRVRLPRALAETAVRAWQRDDDGAMGGETPDEARTRNRAGAFALIGLSIEQTGEWQDDHVIAEVDSWLVGSAVDAADDAGMLNGQRPGA